jgi:inorganic pyrophosphatase
MARTLAQIPPRTEGGFHVVVESPRGSSVKWKYEPAFDAFSVSRPLPLGITYPFDWGFVPGTRAPDGDPLDAMIFWDERCASGAVVPCRALGVLKVEQDSKDHQKRERNDRVLAVPLSSRREASLKSVFELPERVRDELEQFFQAAVAFEEKHLELIGWNGPDEAERLLSESIPKRRRRT